MLKQYPTVKKMKPVVLAIVASLKTTVRQAIFFQKFCSNFLSESLFGLSFT